MASFTRVQQVQEAEALHRANDGLQVGRRVVLISHCLGTFRTTIQQYGDTQQRSLEEAEFLSLFPGSQKKGSAIHISQASLLLCHRGAPQGAQPVLLVRRLFGEQTSSASSIDPDYLRRVSLPYDSASFTLGTSYSLPRNGQIVTCFFRNHQIRTLTDHAVFLQ